MEATVRIMELSSHVSLLVLQSHPLSTVPSVIRPDEGNHVVNVNTRCVYSTAQLSQFFHIQVFDPYNNLVKPVVVLLSIYRWRNRIRGDHCHENLIYK